MGAVTSAYIKLAPSVQPWTEDGFESVRKNILQWACNEYKSDDGLRDLVILIPQKNNDPEHALSDIVVLNVPEEGTGLATLLKYSEKMADELHAVGAIVFTLAVKTDMIPIAVEDAVKNGLCLVTVCQHKDFDVQRVYTANMKTGRLTPWRRVQSQVEIPEGFPNFLRWQATN